MIAVRTLDRCMRALSRHAPLTCLALALLTSTHAYAASYTTQAATYNWIKFSLFGHFS